MNDETIIIPELEKIAERYNPHLWSKREESILRRYYNKVNLRDLIKYLPEKSDRAIRNKAASMRLTRRKNK